MRTTVTLDADSAALVERAMRERGLTFKEAINHGLRLGLGSPSPTRAPRTLRLGGPRPGIDLDKATQLAAALEDDEIARKLELRK